MREGRGKDTEAEVEARVTEVIVTEVAASTRHEGAEGRREEGGEVSECDCLS